VTFPNGLCATRKRGAGHFAAKRATRGCGAPSSERIVGKPEAERSQASANFAQ
jgi:hypothetical protein